jgi:hypothetical protein
VKGEFIVPVSVDIRHQRGMGGDAGHQDQQPSMPTSRSINIIDKDAHNSRVDIEITSPRPRTPGPHHAPYPQHQIC